MAHSSDASHESLKRAEAAEDQHRRLCRLFSMDHAELREILARDPAEAAPWVETAARHGVPEAQLRLGQMLLDGVGAPKDETAALVWFKRGAEKGAPEAMNMVGRCYENGWGVEPDLAAAARWYRRAAEAGCDWGQYNLGHMVFDGRGVARNRPEAFLWYRRAAEQGHARAMNLVGRCYDEGWGVRRDPAQARTWYRRSAEAGYFRGQYNHASCLAAQGRTDEALTWLDAARKAATPDSLAVMARELEQQSDPQLSALGRRFSRELTNPNPPRNGAPR